MLSDAQFKRGVENCGGQVTPFIQDDLVDKRAYMDKGACAQFAAIWIRNQKYRAIRQELPNRDQQFEEVSWMCEQTHKRGASVVFKEFFQGNGLRAETGRIIFIRNFNLEKVAFFVLAQRAYYLIGAVNGDDGHSIACNTMGFPTLFDPDYGTAIFRNGQGLARFLNAYWLKAYTDLNVQGFVQRYR